MPSVDTEKVIKDLTRRFAEPLPEFYKRRIIFWKDPDGEFIDKIDDIEINAVKIIVLTGSNSFQAKKQLAHDDTASNYLVYCPIRYDNKEDNWLLDIELYSEEFRADLNSIWMDEMGLSQNHDIRKSVKRYNKFFNNIDRRKKVSAMSQSIATSISTSGQVHVAVMAAICGVTVPDMSLIIRAVLSKGLATDDNSIYLNMADYCADEPFWAMVSKLTGFSVGEQPDLMKLAQHIFLTAATRTMSEEHLAGLESLISTPYQAYCYDLVSDWMRSGDKAGYHEVAGEVEDALRLRHRFLKMDIEDLLSTECFACVDECILTKLLEQVSNEIIDTDLIKRTVEKRRALAWFDGLACYYEGLLEVVNMQTFFTEHAAGFHLATAQEVWGAYTKEYYRMDTYYRRFHLAFQKSLTTPNEALDDLMKQVVDKVEALYNGWFLTQLGENWSNVTKDELKEHGRIQGIRQQESFYRNNAENADSRHKVYVVVSDALRYEVAASLTEQLRRDTQSEVDLSDCEGIFPTITKYGMAALLPHKELTIATKQGGEVTVLADGQPTEGKDYRDKILKSARKESVALRYDDIIALKKEERRALVKGMDVVYIYHDRIDEMSHNSDTMVFSACEDAIAEIKNIVRIICNDFGGTRIFITSDHGFLYTYSPLREEEKIGKADIADRVIEYGRRYCLLKKGEDPDYFMPVRLFDEKADASGYAPMENIRIKLSGAGLNYVHGGTCLQEMVVPIIEYHFLRNQNVQYQSNKEKYDTKPVEVALLSASRKVTNMVFSLDFFQKDAVGDNREACNYSVYFTNANGSVISDTSRIIADKTSDDSQERIFRCTFNLKSLKYDKHDPYYLVVMDEAGLQAPVKEEFQIDIAFAVEDFGF